MFKQFLYNCWAVIDVFDLKSENNPCMKKSTSFKEWKGQWFSIKKLTYRRLLATYYDHSTSGKRLSKASKQQENGKKIEWTNRSETLLRSQWQVSILLYINPLVPNAFFLYPLKTSGVEKGCIGNKWVNLKTRNDEPLEASNMFAMPPSSNVH